MFRIFALAAAPCVVLGEFLTGPYVPPNIGADLAKLGPILQKIQQIDPTVMKSLSKLLHKSEKSFLQMTQPDLIAALKKAGDNHDVKGALAALGPILQHVQGENQKNFKKVMQIVDGAAAQKELSLLQQMSVATSLHSMSAGSFEGFKSHLLDSDLISLEDKREVATDLDSVRMDMREDVESGDARRVSFLQTGRTDPLVEEQRLMKIGPILAKLAKIDHKTFGGLASLAGHAQKEAGEIVMES